VAAFVNWPGHIKAGDSTEVMHVVDWYPTLAALAGAPTSKAKPLDGMNMWSTLSEGTPSPRTEVVYNIEPFRAAVRQGDWKLVWRTTLPSLVELYNIPQDPSEKNNVAGQHPEIVAPLQKRAEELAGVGQAAVPRERVQGDVETDQSAAGLPRRGVRLQSGTLMAAAANHSAEASVSPGPHQGPAAASSGRSLSARLRRPGAGQGDSPGKPRGYPGKTLGALATPPRAMLRYRNRKAP
jgi:hypothetical protein